MKTLISLLFITALSLSASAKETTVNLNIFIHNNWFSCDSVENTTRKHIESLGGELVDIRCNGGLPYAQYLRVTAVIETASEMDANTTLSTIRYTERTNRRPGRDAHCALDVKILDSVLTAFDVIEMEKRNSCWGSKGRYSYDLTLRNFNN